MRTRTSWRNQERMWNYLAGQSKPTAPVVQLPGIVTVWQSETTGEWYWQVVFPRTGKLRRYTIQGTAASRAEAETAAKQQQEARR